MREIAFYGDGYSEIVIAATLELLMQNKRVTICELGDDTREKDILVELNVAEGIRGGAFLKVVLGYDETDCDYRFMCMGTGRVWRADDVEHYMIINYSWDSIITSLKKTRAVSIRPRLVILGPKLEEISDIVDDIIDECSSVKALPYSKTDSDLLMELRLRHLSCMRLYSKELKEILEDIMQ